MWQRGFSDALWVLMFEHWNENNKSCGSWLTLPSLRDAFPLSTSGRESDLLRDGSKVNAIMPEHDRYSLGTNVSISDSISPSFSLSLFPSAPWYISYITAIAVAGDVDASKRSLSFLLGFAPHVSSELHAHSASLHIRVYACQCVSTTQCWFVVVSSQCCSATWSLCLCFSIKVKL